jgi:HEAT repeat protein
MQLPAPVAVTATMAAVAAGVVSPATNETLTEALTEQRTPPRAWTAAQIAAARAQIRDYRSGGSLEERWRQALADAARQRLTDFWIVYTFATAHGDSVVLNDTSDDLFVSSSGGVFTQGPPLNALLNQPAIPLEGGRVAVLLHYRGARADAIDRGGYRSLQLGFDPGRAPMFWLGDAPESESFARVQNLFDQVRTEKIQVLLIELASLHSNTDLVLPFLTRFVDLSWPSQIREEAAEGFGHHHDPRSVEILVRVARTDPVSTVREEAAETIGEVQTPESIPALTALVNESSDPAVRGEAAEAFGEQPAARAIAANEAVIATSGFDEVLSEAVEALGDLDDPAAMAALERIAREHVREDVQAEAIETISEVTEASIHPLILELAVSGRSARIRQEALDAIGDAVAKIGDPQLLDRAQAVIERVVFDDPDLHVRVEALDAFEEFPDERARRALGDIIARHPDARVRREAEEQLRERK